jgi:hypothetical protein
MKTRRDTRRFIRQPFVQDSTSAAITSRVPAAVSEQKVFSQLRLHQVAATLNSAPVCTRRVLRFSIRSRRRKARKVSKKKLTLTSPKRTMRHVVPLASRLSSVTALSKTKQPAVTAKLHSL